MRPFLIKFERPIQLYKLYNISNYFLPVAIPFKKRFDILSTWYELKYLYTFPVFPRTKSPKSVGRITRKYDALLQELRIARQQFENWWRQQKFHELINIKELYASC